MRVPMEVLWAATQEPERHQRWDVRFGRIEYLAPVNGEPQRVTYATSVVPGVVIAGTGESLGDRNRLDGSRWSGLRFWSTDKRSIIEAGAGYWRYVPTEDGIRFLTRFDYKTRWGRFGEGVDLRVFRPVFGGRRHGASIVFVCGSSRGSRPSDPAIRPSPMRSPSPGSPACGSIESWSQSSGPSTLAVPYGSGSGYGNVGPGQRCGPPGRWRGWSGSHWRRTTGVPQGVVRSGALRIISPM
jgi:hypothetical protein